MSQEPRKNPSFELHSRWRLSAALALSLALAAPSAFAQQPPKDGGTAKDPKQVELPIDDLRRMLDEITRQGYVGADEISIDSLAHPGDQEAYDHAQEMLSEQIASSVRRLADLKQRVIRYAVIAKQSSAFQTDRKARQDIVRSYQGQFQSLYNEFVESLMLPLESRRQVLDRCKSDVCVISIGGTMNEFGAFAAKLDRGLNFERMNDQTEIFWNFENPLLRASFSRAFKKIVKPNQDVSLARAAIAGFYAPLSVAGTASYDTVKQVVSLANARFEWLSIDVERAINPKLHKQLREQSSRLFRDQLAHVGMNADGKNPRIIDWERRREEAKRREHERRIEAENQERNRAMLAPILADAAKSGCIRWAQDGNVGKVTAATPSKDQNDSGYRVTWYRPQLGEVNRVIAWTHAPHLAACGADDLTFLAITLDAIAGAKAEKMKLAKVGTCVVLTANGCRGTVERVQEWKSTGEDGALLLDVRWGPACSGYGRAIDIARFEACSPN